VNDNLEAALDGQADGVHVKEHNADSIPYIRSCRSNSNRIQQMKQHSNESNKFIIGTSTHDIESAINISRVYQPDYFFVGTCYLTSSHPEKKSLQDLEGPILPGKVKAALVHNHIENPSSLHAKNKKMPIVFAIGGINETNCHEPFINGSDGVAVIKAVMGATNPESIVLCMKAKMTNSINI
jgi:thiamine monophosphate synthase